MIFQISKQNFTGFKQHDFLQSAQTCVLGGLSMGDGGGWMFSVLLLRLKTAARVPLLTQSLSVLMDLFILKYKGPFMIPSVISVFIEY